MTRLPQITVRAHSGGWLATCDRCTWAKWALNRPPIDAEAEEHRAECARRRNT